MSLHLIDIFGKVEALRRKLLIITLLFIVIIIEELPENNSRLTAALIFRNVLDNAEVQ